MLSAGENVCCASFGDGLRAEGQRRCQVCVANRGPGRGRGRLVALRVDRAAIELLAARGVDKKERERLGALVATAERVESPTPLAVDPAPAVLARRDALAALYAWYKDWSSTAHSVIKKRAHLITLGLAKRKPKKRGDEPGPGPTPGS